MYCDGICTVMTYVLWWHMYCNDICSVMTYVLWWHVHNNWQLIELENDVPTVNINIRLLNTVDVYLFVFEIKVSRIRTRGSTCTCRKYVKRLYKVISYPALSPYYAFCVDMHYISHLLQRNMLFSIHRNWNIHYIYFLAYDNNNIMSGLILIFGTDRALYCPILSKKSIL